MMTVRMWKDFDGLRPWAEIVGQGREHLLAQLLHGNLSDFISTALVENLVSKTIADSSFTEDLGFFDSVAVNSNNARIELDHVLSDYGTFSIDANDLLRVLNAWHDILVSKEPIERKVVIEDESG